MSLILNKNGFYACFDLYLHRKKDLKIEEDVHRFEARGLLSPRLSFRVLKDISYLCFFKVFLSGFFFLIG